MNDQCQEAQRIVNWEAAPGEQNQDPIKECSPLPEQATLTTSAQPSFKIHMDN